MQETAPIQIDFYHLKSSDIASPLAMLSHKAVSTGQKMLILARAEQFDAISTALWGNRPESFLAHDIDEGEGAEGGAEAGEAMHGGGLRALGQCCRYHTA